MAVCIPVSDTETRLILLTLRSFLRSPLLDPLFWWMNRRIAEEDRAIVESSLPIQAPPPGDEASVRTDAATSAFGDFTGSAFWEVTRNAEGRKIFLHFDGESSLTPARENHAGRHDIRFGDWRGAFGGGGDPAVGAAGARDITGFTSLTPEPRHAHYARFRNPDTDETLDFGLALFFRDRIRRRAKIARSFISTVDAPSLTRS